MPKPVAAMAPRAAVHLVGLSATRDERIISGLPPGRGLSVAVASAVRLVREGLALSITGRPRIDGVKSVDTNAAGIAALERPAPDVVLVDLGGRHPAEAATAIKASCPTARLVAFALAEVDDAVFACAASGFDGYVTCDGNADDVHRAIVDAADGRMQCPPHIAAAMFGRLANLLRPEASCLAVLTARERTILELAGNGGSNKDIARRLSISSATVKNHMHSILQKLQVTRRGEATARLHGLPR